MKKRWSAIGLAVLLVFALAASLALAGEDAALGAQPAAQEEQPGQPGTPSEDPSAPVDPPESGGEDPATPPPVQETPAPTPPEQTDPPPPEETEAPQYIVHIHARDTVVPLHQDGFSLLSLTGAMTESGTPIAVRVMDDGGFNVHAPGAYRVLFGAYHPVSNEVFYASCIVRVEGVEEELYQGEVPEDGMMSEDVVSKPPKLSGTSDERYQKYLRYHDEIYEALQENMLRLNAAYAERVDLLRAAFSDVRQHQLMRRVFAAQEETDERLSGEALNRYASCEGVYAPEVNNWGQVLAVFVARSTLNVDDPLDLYNLRKISLDGIDQVFWDMHELSFRQNEGVLELVMTEYTGEEMIERYGLDAARAMQLEELLQPEFQRLFAALTGDTSFIDISEEEIAAIRATLPEGLHMQRERIVLSARALVGKVGYFWGGKYQEIGVNPLWGVPKVVRSANSETTGTVRPLGLDCSGFVSWVFINAAGDAGVLGAVGNGSANQWRNSTSLGWDEAEPGDLAFFAVPGTVATNHVGVVVEKKENGAYMIAHCSSSKNNVVVTDAWSTGFRYMRRPVLLKDA